MVTDFLKWLDDNKTALGIGLIPAIVVLILTGVLKAPVKLWQDRQAAKKAEDERQRAALFAEKQRQLTAQAAAEEQEAARRAIETEISSNLTQLRQLWEGVNKPSTTSGQFEPFPLTPDLTAAFRLSGMDPMRWQRAAWEERAVRTAAALNTETFARAQAFYEDLNRFDVLKGSLGKPLPTLGRPWRLSDGGAHAWAELQEIIRRRIAEGNPLLETPETAE